VETQDPDRTRHRARDALDPPPNVASTECCRTSITPVVAMIVRTFSFSMGRSTTRSIAIEHADRERRGGGANEALRRTEDVPGNDRAEHVSGRARY
jgi:hypothetical protein